MKLNVRLNKFTLAALALFGTGLVTGPSYAVETSGVGINPINVTERDSDQDGDSESARVTGAVYTMSNAVDGNAVLVFQRATNGSLSPAQSYPTGGFGSGGGLGNGHGLVLSKDKRWLLAVNAGSNDISVFAVSRNGLRRTATVPSGGIRPVSVTVDDDLVYALNAGSDNIAGFQLGERGQLRALENSNRPLSGTGTGPAEVSFSPDGRNLVVTEKATNLLDVFPVDSDGLPSQLPNVITSAGPTPFGFAFAGRNELLVANAAGGPGGSSVSTYRLARKGILTVLDGNVPTYQTASCWIEVAPNQRFAYTANTPNFSITGFQVDQKGGLTLLNANGVTASPGNGSRPIDLAFSQDGRFLYSLNIGNQTISAFQVNGQGALTSVATMSGIPGGANGLAAR
jgi:6-phosphogluconolactonase